MAVTWNVSPSTAFAGRLPPSTRGWTSRIGMRPMTGFRFMGFASSGRGRSGLRWGGVRSVGPVRTGPTRPTDLRRCLPYARENRLPYARENRLPCARESRCVSSARAVPPPSRCAESVRRRPRPRGRTVPHQHAEGVTRVLEISPYHEVVGSSEHQALPRPVPLEISGDLGSGRQQHRSSHLLLSRASTGDRGAGDGRNGSASTRYGFKNFYPWCTEDHRASCSDFNQLFTGPLGLREWSTPLTLRLTQKR